MWKKLVNEDAVKSGFSIAGESPAVHVGRSVSAGCQFVWH